MRRTTYQLFVSHPLVESFFISFSYYMKDTGVAKLLSESAWVKSDDGDVFRSSLVLSYREVGQA